MAPRRANATNKLLEQVNDQSPDRDKSSDGWIGDEAHASRKSDHNPNKAGIVQAQDISHDPAGGFDSYKFAEMLRGKRDRRIKYVISNRKIFSGNEGPQPWTWRGYTGSNPHDMHAHVSVADDPKLYDDASVWDIGAVPFVPQPSAPTKDLPVLRQDSKGFYVEMMQTCLKLPMPDRDRDFGPNTKAALQQFQRDHKLDPDGVVGPYTWRELLRPWAEEVELSARTPPVSLPEPPITLPEPGPEPPTDVRLAVKGKCSWFGGPNDKGVKPDEGLAFISNVAQAPHLFLPYQPSGTTGLARRLNPEVYYIACRWDYKKTPREMLLKEMASVRAGDRELKAYPADWGPNEKTGRVADISPGLMEALGITTDDEVTVTFPVVRGT